MGPFGEQYELSTRFDSTGGQDVSPNVHDAESWRRTLDWLVDEPKNRDALRKALMRAVPRLGAEAHSIPERRLLELLAREVASGEIMIGVRSMHRPVLDFESTLAESVTALAQEAKETGEQSTTDPESEASESSDTSGTSDTTPAPAPVVECILDVVGYECSHVGERKAALRIEADNPDCPRVLEVIAGGLGDGETITVKPEYSADPCGNHQPKSLVVSGPGLYETKAHGDNEVVLHYDLINKDRLIDFLFAWKLRPATFTLSPQTCTGRGMAATIRVYPALSVKAHFMLKLDTMVRVDKAVDKAQDRGYHERRGRPAHTDWRFSVGIKVKYGSHATELSFGNPSIVDEANKVKKWAAFNRLVKRAIDLFTGNLFKYAGVTVGPGIPGQTDKIDVFRIRPLFPQLEIEYEGKFQEIVSAPEVGTAWHLKFKAAPLFGIEARLEILGALIRAGRAYCMPLAVGLEKIRAWAKDKGQTFEIYIALQGVIEGECALEKKPELQKGSATGMIQGALKVLFEASASFGSSGMIRFSFGAEVKGNTGLAVRLQVDHDDKGVFVQGKFALLECKFEMAAWASGKFIWEVKESYEREFVWWTERDLLSTGSKYILTN